MVGYLNGITSSPAKIKIEPAEVLAELGDSWDDYTAFFDNGYKPTRNWMPDIMEINNKWRLNKRLTFQYIRIVILDAPAGLQFSDLNCNEVSAVPFSKIKPLEGFSTKMQQIDLVAQYTLRNCIQEVFEDGPKRDQRLWLGDLRLQALLDALTFKSDSIVKRCFAQSNSLEKVPVIVITDLYHPAQDPGDNFDLITAFALPQIDLKAVILDCTEPFRQPVAKDPGEGLFPDGGGPREAGYIPMMQLNFIFDRNVPFAAGPFYKMTVENDKMLHIPNFQQQGIELLVQTLKNSPTKVQIVSFGSARVLAVAFNREPKLFKTKVARIHLSAGASGPDFLEWNVALDQLAIKTMLNSRLPIALYPCAADTANGFAYGSYNYPFSYNEHNTYYILPNLNFINKMDTVLQRYLAYAFQRTLRNDFLRAMENDTILSNSPTEI